jgi:hypothetical protein
VASSYSISLTELTKTDGGSFCLTSRRLWIPSHLYSSRDISSFLFPHLSQWYLPDHSPHYGKRQTANGKCRYRQWRIIVPVADEDSRWAATWKNGGLHHNSHGGTFGHVPVESRMRNTVPEYILPFHSIQLQSRRCSPA